MDSVHRHYQISDFKTKQITLNGGKVVAVCRVDLV